MTMHQHPTSSHVVTMKQRAVGLAVQCAGTLGCVLVLLNESASSSPSDVAGVVGFLCFVAAAAGAAVLTSSPVLGLIAAFAGFVLMLTVVGAATAEVYEKDTLYTDESHRFWQSDWVGRGMFITLDRLTGCRFLTTTGRTESLVPLLKSDGTPDCTGPKDFPP